MKSTILGLPATLRFVSFLGRNRRACVFASLAFSTSAFGQWYPTYGDLHDFGGTIINAKGQNCTDGTGPCSSVTFDGAGNMYGTTYAGDPWSFGMVWEVSVSGDYIDLHDFGGWVTYANGTIGDDGFAPQAGVTFDSGGNMYGTATNGGESGYGMVWEITTSGKYLDLHDFGGKIINATGKTGPDGTYPAAGVTLDRAGNMYGTCYVGGPNQTNDYSRYAGMVWEITVSGEYIDLHDFGGKIINATGKTGPDGFFPWGGVACDKAGNLYGTATGGGPNPVPPDGGGGGMLWEITASREYKDLHDFGGTATDANGTSSPDGWSPVAVAFDAAGNMCGTTGAGGWDEVGMVWEITTLGEYRALHDFGGWVTNANGISGPDGSQPNAGVTFDSVGNMYGTCQFGGGGGMLWEITASGEYRDLHDFGGTVTNASGVSGPDGYQPCAGVTFDGAGNLYGTAAQGGQNAAGMVWSLLSGPGLATITVKPTSVAGGSSSIGTVTLSGIAGPGGVVVYLSSNSTSAMLPASISVASGATSSTFTVATTAVSGNVTAIIAGTVSGATQTATLTITPATLSSLTLSPALVLGGVPSTGTVTLTGPAGPGGTVVSLSSSSTSATLPASVTVAPGATSASFTIVTAAVSSNLTATITATQAGATQSATLTITAASLSGLTVSPTSVVGGNPSLGTITLNGAAGPGGATVTLASNSLSAAVPAIVTVPAGASSATFTVTTSLVASNVNVTITAGLNGATVSANLNVEVPLLAGLSISPNSVVGGNSATGTVTLARAAPSGGATVSLSSSTGANVPTTVTVPAGASSASFTIATSGQSTSTTATVTASLSGTNKSGTLSITAAALTGLGLAPNPVAGGNSVVGSLSLNGAAPASGLTVNLSSSNTAAGVPASVTIPSGASSAQFSIPTKAVSRTVTATISAASSVGSQSASLTIQQASLLGLSLTPTMVVGGSKTSVSGTVTLTGLAASPGDTVMLSSSNTKLASVPASVRVASGASTATFTVTHRLVTSTQTVTITASYGGNTQTATLTLNPFQVMAVDIAPSSVTGGTTADGSVILNAEPGSESGAIIVKLISTSKSVIVPASVNVPIGLLAGLFTIRTAAVATSTTANVTATYGSNSQSASLTVLPATLVSVSLSPSSVKGSSGAVVTGTLSLSGPAPAGGLKITLSSSDPSAASVPATVTIPAGATTAKFKVSHFKVSAETSVTISATLGSTSTTAVLTVS